MLALSDTAGVILLVLGVVFVVAAGVALVLRSRVTREPAPDIPPAMEPGPVRPRARDAAPAEAPGVGRRARRVLRGLAPVQLADRAVDEPRAGEGAAHRGDRARPPFGRAVQRGEPARRGLRALPRSGAPRRRDPRRDRMGLPAGPDDDLRRAVDRPPARSSRPPTSRTRSSRGADVMPSWSIRYQGALDDQQINDIVNYLVYMSSKNVPFEDNICINPDAVKAVNSPSASPAGTSGATGSTGPRARRPGPRARPGRRGRAPDARAGSAHLPRVPHRVRHAVQGRGRDDHGVHPVRRQRVPDALARVRQVDGLPGARGLLLGLAHHPLVALVLRLLGPGARHADEPGAARPGAVVGRAGGAASRRRTCGSRRSRSIRATGGSRRTTGRSRPCSP